MNYYGDVTVTVTYRYRVSISDVETIEEVERCILTLDIDDVTDTEELEIINVLHVSEDGFFED